MAKKPLPQMPGDKQEKVVKLLHLTSHEGAAFGVTEYELPESILKKHGIKMSMSEPDIFAIMLMNLTKKAREILGI